MVVRSQSRERADPEASPAPPLAPDGRQLRDALKSSGKRIFPLYDNFSKSVKRHREKSQEREKSRDRAKQRDRLKLKEDEEGVNDRNSANAAESSSLDVSMPHDRGREKTKEKRRFYQRDKSKEKKKNKDKTKENSVGGRVVDIRTGDIAALSRPSSTDSLRDEAIYGSVGARLYSSARLNRSAKDTLTNSVELSDKSTCVASSQPKLGTSTACPARTQRAGQQPASKSMSATAAGANGGNAESPQLQPVPDARDYGIYYGSYRHYGDMAGSRSGLYESPLGRYGSPMARYFTLEQSAGRRPSEHDYETFETVLAAAAWTPAAPSAAAAPPAAAAPSSPGAPSAPTAPPAAAAPSASMAPLAAAAPSAPTTPPAAAAPSAPTTPPAAAAPSAPTTPPAAAAPSPLPEATLASDEAADTAVRTVEDAAAAARQPETVPEVMPEGADREGRDGLQRSVSVPTGGCATSPPAPLTHNDTEASDTAEPAPAASSAEARDDSVVPSADGERSQHQPAVDRAKRVRKLLSLHSRVGSKASVKQSFLRALARPDEEVNEIAPRTTTVGDTSRAKSLPAKYREFFRDKKAPIAERCAESANVAADIKSGSIGAERHNRYPKENDPDVVEIELPGVFGASQMRASLRITLKNAPNSHGADTRNARGATACRASCSKTSDGGSVAGTAASSAESTRAGRSRGKSASKRSHDEQRLCVGMPPATVAALTSKFNALIQATSAESSPSPTSTRTFNLGTITLDKSTSVSKSSSFRRTEAARGSARRRAAALRTDGAAALVKDRTAALVTRASVLLRREVAAMKRMAVASEGGDASGSPSGPGSFRRPASGGADGTARASKPASLRSAKVGGAGGLPKTSPVAFGRDSVRLSGRRRTADARSAVGGVGWTSAVRAEQKKNAAAKLTASSSAPSAIAATTASSSSSPSAGLIRTTTSSKLLENKTTSAKKPLENLDFGRALSTSNLPATTTASRLSSSLNIDNESTNPIGALTHKEAAAKKLGTSPSRSVTVNNKSSSLSLDQKRAGLTKSGRSSIDVSKIFDRELRKITNSGTVAKASELWLKRAQSSTAVDAFKKKSATLTLIAHKTSDIRCGTTAKESDENLSAPEKSTKLTTSARLTANTSSIPKLTLELPQGVGKNLVQCREKSMSTEAKASDKPAAPPSSDYKSSRRDITSVTADVKSTGKVKEANKTHSVTEKPRWGDESITPPVLKPTPNNRGSGSLESRRCAAPSVVGYQKKSATVMFENKIYGATFTPIKESINKYVSAATHAYRPGSGQRAMGNGQPPASASLSRNAHTPVGKSISLKSLPSGPAVSRVREAIHRFEAPTSAAAAASSPPAAGETARKSATLPSRLLAPPTIGRRPAVAGARRTRDFYESIWDGRREYKPNESFLWHGSSQLASGGESPGAQLTSAGESAGSLASSFSDRDTASSLSDASSAAEDEAAARARDSLWRRLGAARAAPAAEAPADYEPTGGSSSSGTVTYENGSDPGYERISGDSCAGYEQIGSLGSRYERIGGPPPSETTSAGYETLAPPSEVSTLCYDDCVLSARLAVVSEDQTDSLGYFEAGSAQYEDIGGVWSATALADGPPPAHDLPKLMPMQTFEEEPEDEDSEDGPQTVNSYQLTDFGGADQVAAPAPQQVSLPSTPRDRTASDRDTGGEWTDIDADGEQEASDDTEASAESPIVITRPHFVRLRNRSRRFSKTRAGRRSWSQSLRNLNSDQDHVQENPWRHTLSGGETDEEWLDEGHLYEALDSHYEPVETVPEAADSDDGVDDDKEVGDEDPDQDPRTNGMQKIAEGMRRRLQKTWNISKSDIRSGISRIRKKSTSTGSDGPVSVVVKPKWSLKNHLRKSKKGTSGPTPSGGDSSTFYLDLVIQPRQVAAADEETEVRSESDPGSNRSSVRRSDTDSLSSLPQADARVRLPSTQSSSSRESATSSAARKPSAAGLVRPRNAPPAPPAPLAAASANSPHQARSHDSSSPGFSRSLSTHSQPSPRPLSAFHSSASVDGESAPPPLPPPAARSARPPPPSASASASESADARHRLERQAACSHDNTEYMLSAESTAMAAAAAADDDDGEEQYTSLLDKEPLYQVYLRDRCYRDSMSGGSEDDYETIREASPDAHDAPADAGSSQEERPPPPPPARRRVQSRPSAIQLVTTPSEGQRSLWCQLPEVINSGVLDKLSNDQKRLQEAMFEVISSEASYQRSLSVLVRHFKEEPSLSQFQSADCVINKADFQDLFSNASKVRQCSEAFLTDLERRWQDNVMLNGICQVMQAHATNHFHVYKHYCANQIIQDRKLKELREKSAPFVEVLRRLESSPQCQSLSLHSFLMLPMQRVTRLPLLVSAILVKLEPGHPEYNSCQQAYQTLTKLVKDCNEEARRNERLGELVSISRQLIFKDIKSFPLVTRSRWLVKKGELLRTVYKADDSKLTFGRKQSRQQTVHVFLFNDLLIISKKKSDDSYVVFDYCLRNMVQLTENVEERADKFLLTLLSNHEGKTIEMLFCCPVESERVRWVEAVTPKTQKTETETVYESWDCPQVQAIHPYTAQQPDEITLHVGDVLKVLRKVPDGWYQGMRLQDSTSGWFPSNRCQQIMSEHVRARHLRQRYQVLRITGDFLRQERERKVRAEKETARGGSPLSERAAPT